MGASGYKHAAKSARESARRAIAAMTVVAIGLVGVVVVPSVAVAAPGDPEISVVKRAPSSVLAGEPVTFTLSATNSASNPGAVPEYNTSLRDVLPRGLAYQAGSTRPSDIGEPTVTTDAAGVQTLIWRDAFDLQVASSSSVTFTTAADSAVRPVGSTITNSGNAYASTDPRYVPRFDASGAPVASSNVQSAVSAATTTAVSALKISKAEPSPESKLLRGIHDHTTVYAIALTNTGQASTTGATVVDYLPTRLEFLGCGGIDNSDAPAEYPGAPRLTATPAVGAKCVTPSSVDTVADPPADGSVVYPSGIYTRVVWNVGTLAAGQTVTIRYAAGIPLRANALFAGGPTAASLGQVANLDNNTGAPTRQSGDAAEQTNYVHAAGNYSGTVSQGSSAAVVADGSRTVTVNDLRIYKSVSPSAFAAGQVATYTLRVDSGEYTDNTAITITDVLPNGVCPLDDTENHATGAPAECAPGVGFAPSVPYQSVTQNADGTFTVVFAPIAVAKNGSTVITYRGRNRTVYTGGDLAGSPPSAGDSFTNRASEQGTSTPVAATGYTGNGVVRDATSATQTTSGGSIAKTVGARQTPMDCSSATYGTTDPVFVEGDRVCFQIAVPFSTTNPTQNAVVNDFLPENTSFEAGSVTYPASNTVDPADIAFDTAGAASGTLVWKVGAPSGGGNTEVPAGATFVVQFSAIVTGSAVGPAPDKPGNVVKLRTTNSVGEAGSLRDAVDFRVSAAPPVGVTKGVESVDGATANGPNVDDVTAREGDVVRFRVDVTNTGTAANSNDVPIGDVTVWDVLPAGIRCSQVSAIGAGGICTDPDSTDPANPTFTDRATRSAIVWAGDPAASGDIAAGTSRTLLYSVTVPNGTSVSTSLINTAAVRSYLTRTDVGSTALHYPLSNIDTTVAAADQDAPAAADTSNVVLPSAVVVKGVTSAINETGNVGGEAAPATTTRATIGEQVTFTTSVTVPAHTTVFRGRFTDPLPTGLTLVGATATYRPDAASATTEPLPAGVTFSATAPPTVAFPTTYDNTTATDQVFTMTITAAMAAIPGNQNGVVRTNTATFTSSIDAAGSAPAKTPAPSASATVTDVEPTATVTKTNNAGAAVSGGQTITYTLRPANAAGRPPLHDAWQLDCLPGGLTFGAYGATPAGVTAVAPVPGTGANGCAVNYTVLSWNLGDLAAGVTRTLTYTATVDGTASGKTSFVNLASISGNSLSGTRTSPTDPGNTAGRPYTGGANSTVTISGAIAGKSVSPTSAPVGETVTYRTSALLPVGVNFYNLSLIDTLPRGIDPASVSLVSTACVNADSSACAPAAATPLTPTAGAASATVIGWLLGDAAAGTQARTVTVTYTARVADLAAATAGAALTNRMHVSWDTAARTAPTSSNASYNQVSADATATVTVLEPSISISKSVSAAHPEPGQRFTYSVTVRNANLASTSPAYNVTVTDTVPAGVVVDPSSISNGGTITGADPGTGGGTIAWTLASLPKNAVTTLAYAAALAPSSTLTTANLVNTARIAGYASLTTGGRQYTGPQTTATVGPYFPKLTATKTTPGGTTAYLGESFAWRITTVDTGNGTAYQLGSFDTLPVNWTYDSGSARVSVNGAAAAQVEPGVATSAGVQTLTWTGLGTLPAGATVTIDFTATPTAAVLTAPGVGSGVAQTNRASSSAQDATGATGNRSGTYGSATTTAIARIASADLAVAKAVGVAPTAGGSGSWTVTVRNTGADAATGPFVVTDDFSAPGVSNVRAAGAGWSCVTAAPITCTATGTLASGASLPVITVTYDVASTVVDGTSVSNAASVSARTYDPATPNNTGRATASVATSADIGVAKTLSSTQLVAGLPVSYRLTVSDAGPSSAAGPITVTDTLPAGTTFVSASGAGWTCRPVGGDNVLSCSRPGPLTVGEVPDALIVTVQVPASQTSAVVNSASVASATADPDSRNNTSTVTTTPERRADVAIQKTHTTEVFVAGDPVDYRIDVTNNGPSDASGVRVADTLPDELTYRSSASSDPNWSCAALAQQVTCDYRGTLAPGTTSLTLTAALSADFDVDQRVINTATVTTTTTDPNPANNSDSDDSSVTASADLAIVKTHAGTITAGQDVAFTLAVRNNGPSDVSGEVTVGDALPAGLTYRSASGSGWDCSYDTASRLVDCARALGLTHDTAAPPITLVARVDSSVGASTITNIATVAGETPDPILVNNRSTDPVEITTEAQLTLAKTLTSASPALAGGTAVFLLQARNDGPSDAVAVTVVDALPENMTYQSSAGDGWTCSATGQSVTCDRDSIAADSAAPPLTITVLIAASTPFTAPNGTTVLTNTAAIDSTTPGTNTDPEPVDVPVVAQADLTLTKTATTAQVVAGKQVTWQLDVSNPGPSDAAGDITVTDTLPAFQTFVSSSAPWTCTASAVPTTPDDLQTVTCVLPAGIGAGLGAPRLGIVAQVDTAAPAQAVTNSASADSPTPGTDGAGVGTVEVIRTAPLTLTKTHSGDAVVGSDVVFDLTVHNDGPSLATDVVVTDPLPAGLTFSSAAGVGWTCAESDGTVSCTLDAPLAADTDSPLLQVTAAVGADAYPGVTNTATVRSDDPALPGSSSAEDDVVVDPLAMLTLVKEHLGELVVGRTATYRLTVGNTGPTASPGPVTVTDDLPAGLSYVSASAAGWDCDAEDSAVSCVRDGAFAVDASAVIILTVQVGPDASPTVVNTASVAGVGSPSSSAVDIAPVTPTSVLSIDKTVQSFEKDVATYAIAVTNAGPSATVDPVVVVDPLPDGLRFVSASGDGWDCESISDDVTCTHEGSIAADASATITLTSEVTGAEGQRIENVASLVGVNGVVTEASEAATIVVPTASASGAGGGGSIAYTGTEPCGLLTFAALALLLGLAMLVGTRRYGRVRRTD